MGTAGDGGSTGGDSISFLAVASAPPRPGSVVEPKTCACGATFYRPAHPADGSEPEKWCAPCKRRQALREEARRGCRRPPGDRRRVSGSGAEQVRAVFRPQGDAELRRAGGDKLRRAAS